MLTRSHARALARRKAAARAAGMIIVSSSATGKGTHIRWTYPEDENSKRTKYPITHIHTRTCHKTDNTAICLMGSYPSISSSESSSSEDTPVVTPTSSFDGHVSLPITPQRSNKPLTTPPRLSPKKLQRSPRGRWITANGAARIVFVEDSQEQAKSHEMLDETKSQRIEERELETLLRERDIANGVKEKDFFVMDIETLQGQVSSTDVEVNTGEALGLGHNRGDTELQRITLMAGGQVGLPIPNGTKLVDPVTFVPYSMDSLQASRVETWRLGVLSKSFITSSEKRQSMRY